MSANPYKIMDKVDGDIWVEKTATVITSDREIKLDWDNSGEEESLTLNEILSQAIKECSDGSVPLLRVDYETALWGVIFEVGNYSEMGKQWIVHGITKGYA